MGQFEEGSLGTKKAARFDRFEDFDSGFDFFKFD
jgi:hypothetical protein